MDEREDAGEPPASAWAEDDFDADAEMARWVADIEAGRERIPEEWEQDGSAVSLSLGDACDLDPALLAAMLGPDSLGGQSLGPVFGQDEAADALHPGPLLAALTEQAVSADELASELLVTANYADARIERDAALTGRLRRPELPPAERTSRGRRRKLKRSRKHRSMGGDHAAGPEQCPEQPGSGRA